MTRSSLTALVAIALCCAACDPLLGEGEEYTLVPKALYDAVALSPDGTRYAAIMRNAELVVREIDGDDEVWSLPRDVALRSIVFSGDGRSLLVLGPGTLRRLDAEDGTELGSISGVCTYGPVSDDGEVVFVEAPSLGGDVRSFSGDRSVHVSEWQGWYSSCSGGSRNTSRWHGAIDPSGERYFARGILWDLNAGTAIDTLPWGNPAAPGTLFLPSGERFASCGKDSALYIRRAADGALVRRIQDTNSPEPIAATGDGQYIVTESAQWGRMYAGDKWLRTWNVKTGELVAELDERNDWSRDYLWFSIRDHVLIRARTPSRSWDDETSGELIVDAYDITSVRLWEHVIIDDPPSLSADGDYVPSGPVFTPNGEHVLVATYYGMWRIRVADGRVDRIRDWSQPYTHDKQYPDRTIRVF